MTEIKCPRKDCVYQHSGKCPDIETNRGNSDASCYGFFNPDENKLFTISLKDCESDGSFNADCSLLNELPVGIRRSICRVIDFQVREIQQDINGREDQIKSSAFDLISTNEDKPLNENPSYQKAQGRLHGLTEGEMHLNRLNANITAILLKDK